MRFSTTLLGFLCSFLLLVVAGCGADTGPAKSTTGSELSQFVKENPQILTEEQEAAKEEQEEEEDEKDFYDADE